jgi:hypothetical protein
MKTQAQVDAEIRKRIAKAIAFEWKRDAQTYESPTYWKYHDKAIEQHLKVEALMPQRRRITSHRTSR